jgi:hypothetical protein
MPPALSKRIHCYSKRLGIRCVTQDGKVMRWD